MNHETDPIDRREDPLIRLKSTVAESTGAIVEYGECSPKTTEKRVLAMRARIVCLWFASLMLIAGLTADSPPEVPSRLCVVWSSADPDVAKNACFMFALNAKKAGWFDVVHLVVWGPSAKLLAEDRALQVELSDMQKIGVVDPSVRSLCSAIWSGRQAQGTWLGCEGHGLAAQSTSEGSLEGNHFLNGSGEVSPNPLYASAAVTRAPDGSC